MATEETLVVHKDILGRELKIGDHVVVPHHNGLKVCQITRFTPKMVKVHPVSLMGKPVYRSKDGYLKYAHEMAIVPGEDVFVHALTS